MRNQPTGKPDPRENPDSSADEAAGSELVELGETRLPTRLDVAPTAVQGGGGRRPDPRVAFIVAGTIVAAALLGTGSLAPKPTASPSPSLVATETSSPAPTDSCPVNGVDPVDPPIVGLGEAKAQLIRRPASGTATSVDGVAVVAPVSGVVQANAGRRMQLRIPDASCLELLGIDLFDASRPGGSALTVRAPSPLEPGATSLGWDGPPAGDWIVRIALQLRTPGGERESAWAIYLFRLNSGFVAWSSPVPSGVGGGIAEGPLVTPAVPCTSLSADLAPPAVELRIGERPVAGIVGEYQWRGTTFASNVREGLLAIGPAEIDGPVGLQIVGNTCATSWYITAGTLPSGEEAAEVQYYVDQSPENPANDPRIAAQNAFSFGSLPVFGTFALRATFDFENGDREVMYWFLHAAVEPVPEARATVAGPANPVILVQGCGAEFSADGRYGVEVCDGSWPALPEGPALDVPADGVVHVTFGGQPISGWAVVFASVSEIETAGRPACPYTLTSGFSGIGLARVELPPFPPGDWIVRVSLTSRDGESSVTVPYFIRVSVEGEPVPLPTPSCGGII